MDLLEDKIDQEDHDKILFGWPPILRALTIAWWRIREGEIGVGRSGKGHGDSGWGWGRRGSPAITSTLKNLIKKEPSLRPGGGGGLTTPQLQAKWN